MLILAKQIISEPLAAQRVQGRINMRFWAQSLDPDSPATWAITVRIVSRDGKIIRGELLPLITGTLDLERDVISSSTLELYQIGPFDLIPLDVETGDCIIVEIGSQGRARIEMENDKQSWIKFSQDLLFKAIPEEIPQSRNVDECIYCFPREKRIRDINLLRKEHVIAKGLNGELVLQRASCKSCADITSKFELEVLRGVFHSPRTALKMRSRRPNDRLTHLPLVIERKGKHKMLNVPIEEYPAIIATPLFAPPSYLSGVPYTSGITITSADVCQVAGLPLEELRHKYEADYVGTRLSYRATDFARMIGKIGYAYAVLVLGIA